MPSSSGGGGLEAANNLSSQHIRCSAYKMKDENKMLKACRILYYWNQFILALSVALISLPWHLLVLKFPFQLSVVVNTMHCMLCETDLRRGVKMSQGCDGMAQHVVILQEKHVVILQKKHIVILQKTCCNTAKKHVVILQKNML